MISSRKEAIFVFEDMAFSFPLTLSPCWRPRRRIAFHLPVPNYLSSYFCDIGLGSSPIFTLSKAVSYTSLSQSDGSDLWAVASFHASASSSFSSGLKDSSATGVTSGKIFEASTKPATLKPLGKRAGSCQSGHFKIIVSVVRSHSFTLPAAMFTDLLILLMIFSSKGLHLSAHFWSRIHFCAPSSFAFSGFVRESSALNWRSRGKSGGREKGWSSFLACLTCS